MEEIRNNELPKTVNEKFNSGDVADNKGTAALSYFFVLVFIPLFTKRRSGFVQAHARQGLFLCLAEIIVAFIFWIPVLGWLLALAILIAAISGIIQALNSKYSPLPFIGGYIEKIKI